MKILTFPRFYFRLIQDEKAFTLFLQNTRKKYRENVAAVSSSIKSTTRIRSFESSRKNIVKSENATV